MLLAVVERAVARGAGEVDQSFLALVVLARRAGEPGDL
jgi:hypothetical protein